MRARSKATIPAEELAARLKRLIVATLRLEGLEPEAIGDDQLLFGERLGLDSIDALELVVAQSVPSPAADGRREAAKP